MIRRALLASTLLVATAHAHPTITVDDSVPFTAKELADAVEIRVRNTNANIHIARSGDVIVITVGDHARVLEVDGAPPHDLARVVALVIVSLADSRNVPPPISTAPLVPVPPVPPVPPMPPMPPMPVFEAEMPPGGPSIHVTTDSTRPPSRYALRGSIGYQRTDGGVYTTPFLASLATSITPQTRFVVSAGLDQHGTKIETSTSVLGRLGVEGRFGALGIEIGGAGFAWRTCEGDVTTAAGAYGTARVYLPLFQSRGQLIIEAGGYYVGLEQVGCDVGGNWIGAGADPGPMNERSDSEEYAGHIGIGVEWGL